MTLTDFINATNGKYIDVDGVYGAQCWDLVELYAEQVLQVPKDPWAITLGPEGDAKEAWTVFDAHLQEYFTKEATPVPGDIAVYGPHGAYTEGHIAIFIGNGLVFEQNADPDGAPAHAYNRANTYLLGYLRRKGDEPMVNEGDVVNAWRAITGSDPTDTDKAAWVGKDWKTFAYDCLMELAQTNGGDAVNIAKALGLSSTSGFAGMPWKEVAYDKLMPAIGSADSASVLKPGVYKVQ